MAGDPPPTLAEVAAAAGVSMATVSKVMNFKSDVSAMTRQRVLEVVRQMGYQPDPLLSALVKRRWYGKDAAVRLQIALLWADGMRRGSGYSQQVYRGFQRQAHRRGYTVHELDARHFRSIRGVDRHLRQLGIVAVVSVGHDKTQLQELDWDRYYHIHLYGHQSIFGLNQVRFDWGHAVDMATRKAVQAAYARIGYVTTKIMNEFEERVLRGSFLLNRDDLLRLHPNQPEILFYDLPKERFFMSDFGCFPGEVWRQTVVHEWFMRNRPDVIISSDTQPYHMLKMAGVRFPEDCAFITLREGESETDQFLCAMNHRPEYQGEVAVDMIHHLVQTGQRGRLASPVVQLVEGAWFPGSTFPSKV